MSSDLRVAVVGATGFVGRHVVRELLSRGHEVRALARDVSKASAVLPVEERLRLVEGDLFDARALDDLIGGSDAVVNAVGLLRETGGGQTFKRVHVVGTRRLTEAATRGRCGRYVQISALGVSDEADTAYARSKFEAEGIVRSSGLSWTILRPSLVHGSDGEFMQMARGWATGRSAPFVFMPYFARMKPGFPKPEFESAKIQPVYVKDVARAVAEALERPDTEGEVYHLTGGETLTWPELLGFVRDRTPLAKPGIRVLPIPAGVAAAKAKMAAALGMGALLPFDEGMARMGARDSVASSVKAREHLGFEPAGFRETAAGYVSKM